jgi:cytochrome c551/c552
VADEPATSATGDRGHADHDPEVIVALLDRDLPSDARSAAIAQTEACASCRALLADLRALATAAKDMPAPARARDFTLTPDVASKLRPTVRGELVGVATRLSGEMTYATSGHEAHDRLLIASLVDRSIADPERARALEQVRACGACAELHAELVALSAATKALPTPLRRREFTLSPADADRLRVRGWRRLIAAIGSSRDAFSRPLALGFTTLGIAGLLLSSVSLPFGGAASGQRSLETVGAPVGDSAAGSATQEFAAEASGAPVAPEASGPAMAAAAPSSAPSEAAQPVPAASPGEVPPDVLFEGGESSPLPGEPAADRSIFNTAFDQSGSSGPSPMFVVAAALLVIGLGLFGLRWTARRLGDG